MARFFLVVFRCRSDQEWLGLSLGGTVGYRGASGLERVDMQLWVCQGVNGSMSNQEWSVMLLDGVQQCGWPGEEIHVVGGGNWQGVQARSGGASCWVVGGNLQLTKPGEE